MSTKKLVVIAAAAVALVLLIIAAVVLISGMDDEGHVVKLPDTSPVTDGPGGEGPGAIDALERVSVDTDTVQAVVRALPRPESYSRSFAAESFWDGGSAACSVEAYVSGGASRIVMTTAYETKNVILDGGRTYVWYGSEPSVYVGDGAGIPGDEYQMLVTYEDILDLPRESITAASYELYAGKSCIYVQYASGRLGYVTRCYVSSATGLVVAASVYDGDRLIYSMRETSYSEGEPDADVFALPDGTRAVTRPE